DLVDYAFQLEVLPLLESFLHGRSTEHPADMAGEPMAFVGLAPQLIHRPDCSVRNGCGEAMLERSCPRCIISAKAGAAHRDALRVNIRACFKIIDAFSDRHL